MFGRLEGMSKSGFDRKNKKKKHKRNDARKNRESSIFKMMRVLHFILAKHAFPTNVGTHYTFIDLTNNYYPRPRQPPSPRPPLSRPPPRPPSPRPPPTTYLIGDCIRETKINRFGWRGRCNTGNTDHPERFRRFACLIDRTSQEAAICEGCPSACNVVPGLSVVF